MVEIVFIGLVLAYSVPLLRRLYPAPTPALEWSMACFYAGVAVGGIVIMVAATAAFFRTIAALRARA